MTGIWRSACCDGEVCNFQGCEAPADRKMSETIFIDDPLRHRHPWTAYLCFDHFRQIVGEAADITKGPALSQSRQDGKNPTLSIPDRG